MSRTKAGPSGSLPTPAVDQVELLRTMLRIRLFEEKVGDLFTAARLHGAVHLCIGQEAVAAGACAALRPDDYITSTHRGHGHCIAKGGRLDLMMAELFGKATGYCKGKGGSMHIADLNVGILGANGIVGGGIPIAVGAALACKTLDSGRLVLCFFSDGASNQGSFHEAANLAAVLKLPVIFLCENNQWAVSTPASRAMAIADVAERASGYGMPGSIADGNDPLDVLRAVSVAAERARFAGGPSLVEAKTYRWEGHYRGDPQVYRSREEVDLWRQTRDPVVLFQARLEAEGRLQAGQAQAIREAVAAELEAAVRFAESSPDPSPEELYTDLMAEGGRQP
jgi:TPP-dependent pyruvate/acetoin dehydrogenase alpha subunit